MAKNRRHLQATRLPLFGARAREPLDLQRKGMPALDSIHDDSVVFKPRGGRNRYQILKTTEVERYEKTKAANALSKALHGIKQPSATAVKAAAKVPPATGDNYAGVDRKTAKLSVVPGPAQNFADVSALIATLPSVAAMVAKHIPVTATSGRVKEEQRRVHLKGFLYAASREADNDFHLIVGLDPKSNNEMYMTMEVSGLPPSNQPSFAELNGARTSFKNFFGKNLPDPGYHFYNPPIPMDVEGSLFFDATHSTGQAPGPPSLKSRMPTIWEVHPISTIKLGP